MICRVHPYKVGDMVTVKSSYPYQLPDGLAHGSKVKVVGFDIGVRTVETEDGRLFEISMVCINSGYELLQRGKWVPFRSAWDVPAEDGGKRLNLGSI